MRQRREPLPGFAVAERKNFLVFNLFRTPKVPPALTRPSVPAFLTVSQRSLRFESRHINKTKAPPRCDEAFCFGVPRGIRTPVAAVEGRCPGPRYTRCRMSWHPQGDRASSE